MADDKDEKNPNSWEGENDQQSWQPGDINNQFGQDENQQTEPSDNEKFHHASNGSAGADANNSSASAEENAPANADVYTPAPMYGAYANTTQTQQVSEPMQGQPQPAYPQSTQQTQPFRTQQGPAFGQGYGCPQEQMPPQRTPADNSKNPTGPGYIPPARNQVNQPYSHQMGNGQSRTIFTAVMTAVLTAVLMLVLGWAAITNGWITVPGSSSLNSVNSNSSGSGSAKIEAGQAPDWQTVAKQVSDSVVSIQVQVQDGVGAGSGAILDTEGHIVTNNHVVSGGQKIQVTLSNGQLYSATVVGTDSTADLAVIKLENATKELKPVEFADSDQLAVGENVMAIGNPLGYDNTATTGIVSALNRPVSVVDEKGGSPVVTNAVQLDAAINPGNSGGPTFNAAGQVIGINSSIASTANSKSQAGSIGIGFAIPANLAKRISGEIIKDGKVKHVALGISIQSGNTEADGVARGGARVVKVASGSPAQKAGIRTNDTIVAFNDHAVNNNYSLLGFVRAAQFGTQSKITVVRDGKTLDLNVTMDQEEQTVNATPKSDSNGRSRKKQLPNGGSNDSGESDDDSDDSGNGFFDPFEYFFGQ